MGLLTFKGGIHPPDSKGYSEKEAIKEIYPEVGAKLVFPMHQHIGAPCEPTVAKGERVLIGQKIGEAKGYVSAPVHSSTSGMVVDVVPWLTPNGSMVQSVVVERDGKAEDHPDIGKHSDYTTLSRERMLEMIKEAGIVGQGGAGFPTHVKLNPPPEKKIEYFILNAAECEPYLTTDHRVLLEEPDEIVRGVQMILHMFPEAKGFIGIESNKPDAIKLLTEKCKDIPRISVVGLQTKYPQGAEKQLIYACTGREVPSGGLPADVGCIVNNVDTIIAIERAIERGRPISRRVVTVSGKAAANPGNYKVRLGMTFADLLKAVGGFKEEPYKLVAGGPMMGMAMYTLDVPIIKTSGAILCLTKDECEIPPEKSCIRCARCVNICPSRLMPLVLNANVVHLEFDNFKKNNGVDCIECGSCSYVCPAKRHLAQSIRYARRQVL
ncbi:MAG: electron transport complex subunit RsxC, partial [Defluviitaleaceae bacterium]|nr:electron transport complex subunit RsxC [Defluviitaleaceae bacterium]